MNLARTGQLVILLLGWLWSGCGNDDPLVIYSPHGKEMLSAFEQSYESQHPGVDVQWLDMGSQDVHDRIRTERNNPQADIWWGAPWLMFRRAEEEGLLEPYHPSWRESIPAEYRSANGYWYGTFVTPEVIMYNSRVLDSTRAPRDWDDLLDAQWNDKIIIRYPLASGTMRIIYSALIQRAVRRSGGDPEAGFSWLLALDANTKTYAADPTQLYIRIAREEGVVTLWNLPDVVIQREVNNYPFDFIIPESGTPMIIDGIAIVKGTKKKDEASKFYEHVTSSEALAIQAEKYYRIPARSDVNRPSWLGQLAMKSMEIDWEEIGASEREWMKRWDETIKGQGGKDR